jgi:hypothetical protein
VKVGCLVTVGSMSSIKRDVKKKLCLDRSGESFSRSSPLYADALTVALPLASHVAVLAAVMGLDGETSVGPELPLGSETVGCLQQGHQQGSANRARGETTIRGEINNAAESRFCFLQDSGNCGYRVPTTGCCQNTEKFVKLAKVTDRFHLAPV